MEVADTVAEGVLAVTPAAAQSFIPYSSATGSRIPISLTVSEKGKEKLTRLLSCVARGPDASAVRFDEGGRKADTGCVRDRHAAAASEVI